LIKDEGSKPFELLTVADSAVHCSVCSLDLCDVRGRIGKCTSCERSLNYATKMARMLQSSTYVEVKSAVHRWLHSNQTDFYEQGILKL
ncbi:hypothetical protein L9F63_015059, partial [Diploptera punctata]